jgi:hypothetical protein
VHQGSIRRKKFSSGSSKTSDAAFLAGFFTSVRALAAAELPEPLE